MSSNQSTGQILGIALPLGSIRHKNRNRERSELSLFWSKRQQQQPQKTEAQRQWSLRNHLNLIERDSSQELGCLHMGRNIVIIGTEVK